MTERTDKPGGILSRQVKLPAWGATLLGVNRRAEDLSQLDAQGLGQARRRYTVLQIMGLLGAGVGVLEGYSATLKQEVPLAVVFFFFATLAVLITLYSGIVKKLIELAVLVRQSEKDEVD